MRIPPFVAASLIALSLGGAAFAQDRPGAPASPGAPSTPGTTERAPTASPAPAAGPVGSIGAATLVGVDVRTGAGETIGEIRDVVVDQSGKATSVILGTGGVLGLGERNVPIGWEQIQLSRNEGGSLQATTTLTKEQLEAMPEYTKDRGGWRAK